MPTPPHGPSQAPPLNIEITTHYTEDDKKLWVYLSNTKLEQGRRRWQEQNESWATTISREIDPTNTRVELHTFQRIIPTTHERHLILEAPSPVARRALLDALKASKSHVHIHFHLSPLGQANKTLVYHLAQKNQVHIKDHGDIVHIAWKPDPS
jgi:hypothetical protein